MSQQMKYLDWLFLQGTTLFQNFTQEYIYDGKLLLIAIPIGAQVQQGNMTPVSVRPCTCSFQDRAINLLAWEIISPTSPSFPSDASIARSSGYILP